ncbi:zinc-ribbon domain containing protein [Prosthecobacter sp.]|uniref:zinc-ribbon domain containing protein n=1 Tax=Prosthecobacter sp. TaxID=1965333 RepID=UPI002488B409|nr:zinc-ribbon domain containing protein [Prosthecobacter sp.]MDI1313293.1 zinc-ribbon domain containing protein [Prosthecobacter sp.]
MKKADHQLSKLRLRKVLDDRPRRIRMLLERGLIQNASEIPDDAIPIDPEVSTQATLCIPAVCYQDITFVCTDCGRPDFWSAGSQQHYFEFSKASPYSRPKLCYDCRQRNWQGGQALK